ncbi:MAG: putative ABC transporter ATP-binding protein [Chlamydiae bacterium]|nr:putative ABC transporter ATP-binding protein [Chlamydiota bacterium]
MKTAIKVSDLTFGYRREKIFHHLSFSILDKEWIAIIGPNGCGKTTLLKLLAGLLKAKGKIWLFDKPIQHTSIGYMPQVIDCNEHLPINVLDVVLMGRLSHTKLFGKYPRSFIKDAEYLLEELELDMLQKTLFSQLSLGQKQRVLFARALFSHPELLLLDEPLASVDQRSSQLIYNYLKKIKGTVTLCFVTHDVEQILHDVDRVLCLHHGIKLLEPKELCEHFALGLYHTPLVESACLT